MNMLNQYLIIFVVPGHFLFTNKGDPRKRKGRKPMALPEGCGSDGNNCGRCGKVYKNVDSLRAHLRYYCGQEPQFLCMMCPKRFYQKIHVRSHMFSVHGTTTV